MYNQVVVKIRRIFVRNLNTYFIIVTLLIIYKIYNNLKPRIHKQKIFQMISERLDANNSDIQLSN